MALCKSMAQSGGVTDGNRTRDIQDHNLTLCQLSYGHHGGAQSLPDLLQNSTTKFILGPAHRARAAGSVPTDSVVS